MIHKAKLLACMHVIGQLNYTAKLLKADSKDLYLLKQASVEMEKNMIQHIQILWLKAKINVGKQSILNENAREIRPELNETTQPLAVTINGLALEICLIQVESFKRTVFHTA